MNSQQHMIRSLKIRFCRICTSMVKGVQSSIPPPTSRNLWLVICAAVATQNISVFHTSQSATTTVLAVLIWGGALICIEDQLEVLKPSTGFLSLLIGTVILVWVMARSAVILHWEGILFLLAPIAGLGLSLLCKSLNQLHHFRESLLCLLLLPTYILMMRTLPEEPISLFTARISGMWLQGLGFNTLIERRDILLSNGGVRVLGPCNGLDMIGQIICIAVIFLLAFPIRSTVSRLLILCSAPCIGLGVNSFRIALLAIIANYGGGKGSALFDFFHKDGGSLVFSGVGVVLFGMFYMYLLEKELPPLSSNN